AGFPPQSVVDWFADHNLPLKVEEDLRVFPVSNRGQDVVDTFLKIFNNPKIIVHYLEGIREVKQSENGKFQLSSKPKDYNFDSLIITSGGNAYAHTGSTGDGYA